VLRIRSPPFIAVRPALPCRQGGVNHDVKPMRVLTAAESAPFVLLTLVGDAWVERVHRRPPLVWDDTHCRSTGTLGPHPAPRNGFSIPNLG
jgi:hypothetical protein